MIFHQIYPWLRKLREKSNTLKRVHTLLRETPVTCYLYNLLLHQRLVRFFPDKVIIDASTICNLRCPLCPTGTDRKDLTKGFLKFSKFKVLIDEISPHIRFIFLSNKGEIFLNPEIFKIIRYAKNKGMIVEADSNLNYLDKEMAEELVKSEMDYLNISIDGASQKVYSSYRKGGNFNTVIRNIKMINKAKEKYNLKRPSLIWQFIIFDHNKHQLKKVKILAKKLNMKFKVRPNWEYFHSMPKNKKFRLESGLTKNYYSNDSNDNRESLCSYLWYKPVINWNGNMLGCCIQIDENKNFGNVFEKGFFKVFYGKKMNSARKFVDDFLKDKKVHGPTDIPCAYCIKLRNMRNNPVK